MFKRGLWRICWGLGAVFKAGSDFVAFVAKRQECLDKASPFYFFPGCVSVSSLVALEVDGKFELFEGFSSSRRLSVFVMLVSGVLFG